MFDRLLDQQKRSESAHCDRILTDKVQSQRLPIPKTQRSGSSDQPDCDRNRAETKNSDQFRSEFRISTESVINVGILIELGRNFGQSIRILI